MVAKERIANEGEEGERRVECQSRGIKRRKKRSELSSRRWAAALTTELTSTFKRRFTSAPLCTSLALHPFKTSNVPGGPDRPDCPWVSRFNRPFNDFIRHLQAVQLTKFILPPKPYLSFGSLRIPSLVHLAYHTLSPLPQALL